MLVYQRVNIRVFSGQYGFYMGFYGFIWFYRDLYGFIWVNEITSSRRERNLEIIVRIWEIIPFYGRKIQVSEL